MAEEEVSLTGAQRPVQNTSNSSQGTSVPADVANLFSRKVKSLKDKIDPNASSKQLVDILLSMSKDELMPFEDVTLPSLGQYYEGKIPGGKIRLRPMSISEDKAFATARLTVSGQALDRVYKNCVEFPSDFDPLDLLNGDRVFILFVLRGITHGNLYEFITRCTNESCREEFSSEFDLNNLAPTIRYPEFDQEPIKVVVPYLSDRMGREMYVKIRYLRGRDNKTIEEYRRIKSKLVTHNTDPRSADAKPELIPLDESIERNLDLVIQEINGETDRNKIKAVIAKMHGSDTATIRSFLTDTMPGIDTTIDLKCPNCGTTFKGDLPITESFFRPKKR